MAFSLYDASVANYLQTLGAVAGILDRSLTLTANDWTPVASWVGGTAPVFADGVTIVDNEVRDTITEPKAFYRYRVVLR